MAPRKKDEPSPADVLAVQFARLTKWVGRAIVPYSVMEEAWLIVQQMCLIDPVRGAKGEEVFFEKLETWIRFDWVCQETQRQYPNIFSIEQ